MGAFLPLILVGSLVVVFVIVLVFRARGAGSAGGIEDRLNELAALGQTATLEELELSQPFAQRVILPMIEGLSKMAQRFTPQNTLEQTRHQIELAGMSHKLKPSQMLGIRMAGGIGLGLLAAFVGFSAGLELYQRLLAPIIGLLMGYTFPGIWLGSKISARQKEVVKALPDALDLLTICVEAGLGFDAAMAKVAEKWDNELSLAFARAVQEMQLGKLRREALRDMANSMDVPDTTSFVAAIIQADTLGVSMAKVMRIQSDTMRMKRRQRAEEKARQAPVKMMIPLVFFIFPTILIVLLGPAFIQIRDVGSS
ncbi:MAG TPA: type II secretion system F family protein [Anaerolineae bacterium]|nr:type II secretion system F family protein [Anaerolineae bacterium]